MSSKPNYSEDPKWADVTPLPQDDGGPNALATIAYTDDYRESMSYLRALIAADERSERVLELTEHIIDINPAHYTVWLFRAQSLFALSKPLRPEIEWLNEVALAHIKNYQIWQHRQLVIEKLNDPAGEFEFLAQMFEKDAKNYHVWSYRQWLVSKFGLWEGHGELEETERHLQNDVRNNSAWNHRWFLVFGKGDDVSEETLQKEFQFAKDMIQFTPQNESPWNYLKGLLRKFPSSRSDLEQFAQEFVPSLSEDDDGIRSTHALDLLAEVYSAQTEKKDDAKRALTLLETKYDPIRSYYWSYRRSLLEDQQETQVVA